mmetsp:Transcript_34069/g.47217  ORF Transcript_34069/g.47217 Transcript_34069/m.47217 type:complete len:200 (+) Transcript_34069:430-1029(+)
MLAKRTSSSSGGSESPLLGWSPAELLEAPAGGTVLLPGRAGFSATSSRILWLRCRMAPLCFTAAACSRAYLSSSSSAEASSFSTCFMSNFFWHSSLAIVSLYPMTASRTPRTPLSVASRQSACIRWTERILSSKAVRAWAFSCSCFSADDCSCGASSGVRTSSSAPSFHPAASCESVGSGDFIPSTFTSTCFSLSSLPC